MKSTVVAFLFLFVLACSELRRSNIGSEQLSTELFFVAQIRSDYELVNSELLPECFQRDGNILTRLYITPLDTLGVNKKPDTRNKGVPAVFNGILDKDTSVLDPNKIRFGVALLSDAKRKKIMKLAEKKYFILKANQICTDYGKGEILIEKIILDTENNRKRINNLEVIEHTRNP